MIHAVTFLVLECVVFQSLGKLKKKTYRNDPRTLQALQIKIWNSILKTRENFNRCHRICYIGVMCPWMMSILSVLSEQMSGFTDNIS
jgi:hypothetical protein